MIEFNKKIILFLFCFLIFCFDFRDSDNNYQIVSGEAREILKFDKANDSDKNSNNLENEKEQSEMKVNFDEDIGLGSKEEEKDDRDGKDEKNKEEGKITNELSPREKIVIPVGENDGEMLATSKDFYRGIHLIYYCQDHHWACVDRGSFDNCKKWREKSKSKRNLKLRCVPIQSYKTESECISKQKKGIASVEKSTIEEICTSIAVDQPQ
ncbi:MAG: hypothetical protein HQK51_05785 [Oligoflexia bacterium]|nr:hypothetical protein [Oligoflexia bacterium]